MFKHIFLVGIGGVSMSGIARILRGMGIKVSGSDVMESVETRKLEREGFKVYVGHKESNISMDVDLVVVSAAIDEKNFEVASALKRDIPVWRRLQLINYLVDEKVMVAVTGMHGKTTVSSMIATICFDAKEDPTIMVGGEVRAISSNSRYGKGELWILEACEYKRSFLDLKPNIAVVTNIEEEHMDVYRDLDDIVDTFGLFVKQVDLGGLVVACTDDKNVRKVISCSQANVAGYGFETRPKNFTGVYWQIKNLEILDGKSVFDLYVDDEYYDNFCLSIPGRFNVLNAVAAIVVADFLVIDINMVKESLKNFLGARRRMDVLYDSEKITIVDDYGHHPTEIDNFLTAIRQKYGEKKLWLVWQPHQYSRTWQFLDKFVDCFKGVDKLILTEIYEARDAKEVKEKIDGKKLCEVMLKAKIDSVYFSTYDEVVDYLKKNYVEGSLLITLGAGPVNEVAEKVKKILVKENTA